MALILFIIQVLPDVSHRTREAVNLPEPHMWHHLMNLLHVYLRTRYPGVNRYRCRGGTCFVRYGCVFWTLTVDEGEDDVVYCQSHYQRLPAEATIPRYGNGTGARLCSCLPLFLQMYNRLATWLTLPQFC
jgi:hypothetical protein